MCDTSGEVAVLMSRERAERVLLALLERPYVHRADFAELVECYLIVTLADALGHECSDTLRRRAALFVEVVS